MVQWILLGAFASAGSAVFGAVLIWFIVPLIVTYMVELVILCITSSFFGRNKFGEIFCFKNVILYEGSEQLERFTDVPQPLHFKVYLFNVTNADRVQNGEIPIVQEIGPYVYRFV